VSKCQKVCSDGVVQAGEACDDGNALDGDGCSSECTVEDKWTCTEDDEGKSVCEEVDLCGNEVLNPENLEECDDGNREAGDGCN
jgi:cysteine-rich repeat protein